MSEHQHEPGTLTTGECVAHYRVRKFLAMGGMGEIYEVEDLANKHRGPLAMKILSPHVQDDPQVVEMLVREAQICRSIHSRHVVRVFDIARDERGRWFIIMELLEGEELFEVFRRMRVADDAELGRIAVQVLRGLYTVHKLGAVHCDLKPENLFVTGGGVHGTELVKILDFGSAQLPGASRAGAGDRLTGTPAYMSPEQWGHEPVDARADLYGLGVMLYEWASGSLPFVRGNLYSMMLAHHDERPAPLPSTVDPEFASIIMRALAKDPEDRWQSAREMREVIERWLDGVEPVGAGHHASPWARGVRGVVAGVG